MKPFSSTCNTISAYFGDASSQARIKGRHSDIDGNLVYLEAVEGFPGNQNTPSWSSPLKEIGGAQSQSLFWLKCTVRIPLLSHVKLS